MTTATKEITKIHEGDVFRFQYHDPRPNGHDLTWAFDGQLVVRKGRLCDTYWGFEAGEPRTFTLAEANTKGTLRFVCNLSDVRKIQDHEQWYYDEADVFDLSHQHGCYKFLAVRKDAKRSTGRMLSEVQAQLDKVRADTEWHVRRGLREIERLTQLRGRIESGDDGVTLGW